jgi:hypothetical protein
VSVQAPPDPQLADAAKRVKDEMDLHAVAGDRGWAVFALADGKPLDHTAYDSWKAAVKAAKWDRDRYFFLEVQPDGMPEREAVAVIRYARLCHDLGGRVPPPDDVHLFPPGMPLQPLDRLRMARQLASGKPLVPAGFAMSNHPAERRTRG